MKEYLMQHQILLTALLFAVVIFPSAAISTENENETETELSTVDLTFSGSNQSLQGNIIIKLHNSQQGYIEDLPYKTLMSSSQDMKKAISLGDIPYGKYALIWHHDKNSNNQFDTNILGIPKEPYGFSNNVTSTFGPPEYDEITFIVDAESLSLVLLYKK